MRRGALGARLCDRAGCPERWPCAVHGTARVGDYEHLGRHAGAFELAEVPFATAGVLDMVWCGGCRHALCSCLAEDELPVGWEKLESDRGGAYFAHASGARVWSCGAKGCVRWGYNRRYIPDLPYEAASCCAGDGGKSTRDAAMAVALGVALASLVRVDRVEQIVTGHDCVMWKQTAPASRSGWTTDGETYFHDAIGLKVRRLHDGGWCVQANGGPWSPFFVHHDAAWFDEHDAMRWAELRAAGQLETLGA